MRIIGIDPGSLITGYGIIEMEGHKIIHISHGEIKSKSNFSSIYDGLLEIISKAMPGEMAIEEVFYGKNAKSLIKQGEARGVALLAGEKCHLPVYEYSPLAIKQAIVGYGRADKKQVQHMVKVILNLSDVPPPDAADALAVAICHAHSVWSWSRL
ncbi:MAG: crossover junction endodeoxyribonuclease RuvC [Syntrophales bacterium]|nr:crossover junction endodeoxyribonuclease RuvC [Syntrophales bacterium]